MPSSHCLHPIIPSIAQQISKQHLILDCDYHIQEFEAASYAEGCWGAEGTWQCAGGRSTTMKDTMDGSNMGDTPLFMRGLNGTTTTIMVSLDITVAVLLTLALDNSSPHVQSGYLRHGRHALNPNYTASNYGIRARDTLTTHMCLRGGPSVPNAIIDLPPVPGLDTTAVHPTGQELTLHTLVQRKNEDNRAFRQYACVHRRSIQMPSSSRVDTLPTATCPGQWVMVQSEIKTLVKSQPKLLTYLGSHGPPKRKDAQLADWKKIGAQYRDLFPLTSLCPVNNHKKSSCWLKAAVMLLFPLASLYQKIC